jgi:hypothetical protein
VGLSLVDREDLSHTRDTAFHSSMEPQQMYPCAGTGGDKMSESNGPGLVSSKSIIFLFLFTSGMGWEWGWRITQVIAFQILNIICCIEFKLIILNFPPLKDTKDVHRLRTQAPVF